MVERRYRCTRCYCGGKWNRAITILLSPSIVQIECYYWRESVNDKALVLCRRGCVHGRWEWLPSVAMVPFMLALMTLHTAVTPKPICPDRFKQIGSNILAESVLKLVPPDHFCSQDLSQNCPLVLYSLIGAVRWGMQGVASDFQLDIGWACME